MADACITIHDYSLKSIYVGKFVTNTPNLEPIKNSIKGKTGFIIALISIPPVTEAG